VVGKHEKVVLELLKNISNEVSGKLFFTFVTRKTTEKRILKFATDNQELLESIGTSIITEEEMDSRPIWFEADAKDKLSDKSRFNCVVNDTDELVDSLLSLKEISVFTFITKVSYDFKRKGKYESRNSRK
jgi:hypothetical protein